MRRAPIRRLALVAAAAVATTAAACAPPETIDIGVRDPSAATVLIQGENGTEVLLPQGRAREEHELPHTSPPYERDAHVTASAIRDEGGGIAIRCDTCGKEPVIQLLQPGASTMTLTLPSRAGQLPDVAWTNDALHVHLSQSYAEGVGRGRRTYEAFRYELVLPRDALTEVRHKRPDVSTRGWIALVVGAALTAASVTLIIDGATNLPSHARTNSALGPALELAGGCVLSAPALGLDLYGLMYAGAPPGFDERVGP
jgi:hypothetical protein